MILITGATGHLGRATIKALLGKVPANQVTALVREEAKAADLKEKGITLKVGDYNDKASLVQAFKGIDKLFFISGNDVTERLPQHTNVVEAAKEAGVKHIIYTSFARKNETATNPLGILATSHIETDKLIKASGITYTILLNTLYADVLPMFFGNNVLETGIYLPAGAGKVGYVKREEIADAAANILTTEGHENKEYTISNAENYSFYDAAGILAELAGKKVGYANPSTEEFQDTLTKAGVPAQGVSVMAGFSEAIKQGEFETSSTDLEQLLGYTPATLRDYFKEVYFSNK